MPGKHVRFNDNNTVYHAPPPTPSPTFSTSSLPSSLGPGTPPDKVHSPLPYGPIVINRFLAFHPALPPMLHDVSYPPTTAQPNSHSSPIAFSSQMFAEPATTPPLPSLTLLHESLPWELVVQPSATPYVTVHDVLFSLHRFLRLSVSSAEFKTLPSTGHQNRVSLAYQSRCNRSPSREVNEDESRKGVKRVDFLMGRNKFSGLSSTKKGPDVWVLNVS